MHLLSKETNINFVGIRKIALAFSAVLILISAYSIVTNSLNFGIDFTGGTMIEVGYPQAVDLGEVRSILEQGGYGDALVQNFGSLTDVLIRLPVIESENMAEISNQVVALLQAEQTDAVEVRRVEFVGPQVGEELAEDGGLAMVYALIGILIYVALRFEYRFAIASVLALVHDVVITVGFFSFFRLDFDLTVLAAILAVIGYSLNDTIVVFDRIRESFLKMRKAEPLEVINTSINATLGRTIMTSMTTLLVVVALFVFGGEVIHAFATALLIGILVGTYSSIYIAGTAVLLMGVTKTDLMPPEIDEDGEVNPDGSQV
ncbi:MULTISPECIES: protein translocase subunit SecF [unclassified Methylophaga]|jgi:preprotein translocase subunit SecF|uniref:protein translocase subunit SecF n=1 Tax=unclassified Methylophaga TaxID=2629249 RepID=UPI000C52B67B|nr:MULTISPECIES: protein translocase subunit SecF [unclassified Methylophaga]MAL50642.1 protein translocase subunit SecF [Methylophaga sp.]MAP26589.1 protein translocase subunit SecF [Methylophaga sp.]MBP24063.1 protein translocase subunit SecF [Methylophaga sp.]MDX1749598.1 protein translocase subunit SecF [Methylophaga sp.]HAD31485.1 protein translocase subunit SecF [Methylophaga sp.]|tara:strand:+ start:5611 stop:6561 length:951 start_codon:yes stop_codon:yes gene_type:complete